MSKLNERRASIVLHDDGSLYVNGDMIYDANDMENFVYDSTCPCICTSCGEEVGDYEPDASGYYCPDCDTSTARSILVIARLV